MNVAAITGGDYGLDSTPILGAGALISIAKAMGGGKQTPGEITISPQQLQQINPTLFNQLVNKEIFLKTLLANLLNKEQHLRMELN